MTDDHPEIDSYGYIRYDAISDWALKTFQQTYPQQTITTQDIFFYTYAILHSPEYRQRFAADLKQMFPRIPLTADFPAFQDAGKQLADLHLNYESAQPYPLQEEIKLLPSEAEYRVQKMRFGRKDKEKDKTTILYNDHITLRGIPLEAYDYVLNGRSAIEWIMNRYQIRVDTGTQDNPGSHIKNDPNDWPDDPRYIIDLLKRIVTINLETTKIINSLPPLTLAPNPPHG